jgi:hypothetical protein
MKYGRLFVLAVTVAMLFSLSAFARSKDEGSMTLVDPALVGSTHLKPGNYKVEWNGTGDHVKVNILEHGKTVATTPAKLVTRPKPSPYNAVVTTPLKNSKAKGIDEIDFDNRTEALVLPSSMARPSGSQMKR